MLGDIAGADDRRGSAAAVAAPALAAAAVAASLRLTNLPVDFVIKGASARDSSAAAPAAASAANAGAAPLRLDADAAAEAARCWCVRAPEPPGIPLASLTASAFIALVASALTTALEAAMRVATSFAIAARKPSSV